MGKNIINQSECGCWRWDNIWEKVCLWINRLGMSGGQNREIEATLNLLISPLVFLCTPFLQGEVYHVSRRGQQSSMRLFVNLTPQ